MPDPINFTSTSPRFGLPFLFVAQAQKEFFVNEALARLDALLHCSIVGTSDMPPANAEDGECWLVGSAPTGDWSGHAGEIACCQSGNWLFAAPVDGMRILDRSSGQLTLYRNGWQRPAVPAAPAGGTTIDHEARTAITALVASLQEAGIFPAAT